MSVLRFDVPISRRTVETVLAGLVLLLGAVWFPELSFVFENSVIPGYLLLPVTLSVPGLLALFVLADVLAHGARLGSVLVGSGDRIRPGDTTPSRILGSVAFGALAAYTLWWATGSVYVIYFWEGGGVLLHPYVVLALGSALGALVLIRTVSRRLISTGAMPRLGGPFTW